MNNKEIMFADNTWFTGAWYVNQTTLLSKLQRQRANILLPSSSTPKTHSSVLLTPTDFNKEKQAPNSKQFTR